MFYSVYVYDGLRWARHDDDIPHWSLRSVARSLYAMGYDFETILVERQT